MKPLTSRQAHVLAFIRDHIVREQRPPVLRELGWHLGIRSTNGVNDHLLALQRKGQIRMVHIQHAQRSRSIQVLGDHLVWASETEAACADCGLFYDVERGRHVRSLCDRHTPAGGVAT